VRFSPDGRFVVVNTQRFGKDQQGRCQVWDLDSAAKTLDLHGNIVCFTPDSRRAWVWLSLLSGDLELYDLSSAFPVSGSHRRRTPSQPPLANRSPLRLKVNGPTRAWWPRNSACGWQALPSRPDAAEDHPDPPARRTGRTMAMNTSPVSECRAHPHGAHDAAAGVSLLVVARSPDRAQHLPRVTRIASPHPSSDEPFPSRNLQRMICWPFAIEAYGLFI
jgi:hypothetical protein